MAYVSLKEILSVRQGYAVGAFNIVNYLTMESVVCAAEEEKASLIIQTSTSTIKHYGLSPLVAWVKVLADKASVPVAMHLDHCKDLEMIKACVKSGWSSVMFDGSSFPFEKNVEMTRQAVKIAHKDGVTVEGELGAIVGVEEDIKVKDRSATLADPKQSIKFVEQTGVDIFAPAVGTAHGLYKYEPKVDFKRLAKISKEVGVPVALHGGTGLTAEVFQKSISSGVSKINISTQLKISYIDSLKNYIARNEKEYNPIKMLSYVRSQVQKMACGFIRIFGSSGKATKEEKE